MRVRVDLAILKHKEIRLHKRFSHLRFRLKNNLSFHKFDLHTLHASVKIGSNFRLLCFYNKRIFHTIRSLIKVKEGCTKSFLG